MFPEHDHLIFAADLDGGIRKYDPLVLRRRLLRAAKGRLGDLLVAAAEPRREQAPAPDEELEDPGAILMRLDAQEKLAGALREAFELPALGEEGGVPEATVMSVWWQWRAWVAEKKTSGATRPTSSPPAAGGPPATPSSSA